MRFLLFVEGETEEKGVHSFIRRWLDAQGLQHVGVTSVGFKGSGHFVDDAPAKAEARLSDSRANQVIAIIGLLDLLRLPEGYGQGNTANEKYQSAKQQIEREVGNDRYRQFFTVHESEAWLLSSPAIFPSAVQPRVQALSSQPEHVNSMTPPAVRLGTAYRTAFKNKGYKKTVDGSSLFAKLDPDIAAGKCPHLRQMLDTMLDLARKA